MRVTRLVRMAALSLTLVGVGLAASCAPSARQRPVRGGPVDTGAGSLEAARKQIEGTWTLMRLEVLNPQGQLQAVRAKAQLTYDSFANLTMKGVLEEPLPGQKTVTEAPALVYTGRAVIDTARQEIVLSGLEAKLDPDPSILAAAKTTSRRKYSIEGNQLTIWVVDEGGRTTFRTVYTK